MSVFWSVGNGVVALSEAAALQTLRREERVAAEDRFNAAERALELMCARLLSREAFGKTLAEHSVWEERIAEARIEIEPDLPALADALRPGAVAVFSGILSAAADDSRARLAEFGFRETARRTAGEWIAFATELAP